MPATDTPAKQASNSSLHAAKTQKNDEFYTQLSDIENELKHYRQHFAGKVVFLNCDDPFESNFFKYFAMNFNALGLKRLIATSYKPSPVANTQLGLFGDDKTIVPDKGRPKVTANKFIINEVHDINGDGAFDLKDVAEQLKANKNNEWTPLKGNGDFRSPECVELLKQADIVVTNPPFSLFREYVAQLVEYNKQFLIISNKNSITYKEIFRLIKENKLWTGCRGFAGGMWFYTTSDSDNYDRIENGVKLKNVPSIWFTNLDHSKRHEMMTLYKRYTPEEYPKYDNYDAIEVGKVAEIPEDYSGEMGVPITFLDKYNPDQFEIIGSFNAGAHGEELGAVKTETITNGKTIMWNGPVVNKKPLYKRIIIKLKGAA